MGSTASSRQRPFAAPHSGPSRTTMGRRGVRDAAAASICSPIHLDSPYVLPAASHALIGPWGATALVSSLRYTAPRSVSVVLINMRRGRVGWGLERATSIKSRSMRKLPSKILRGRLSSRVDNHALCTMWVTEARSCVHGISPSQCAFR